MFVDPQTRLCPLRPQGRAGSVRRRIALLLGAGRGLTGRFQTGDNQGAWAGIGDGTDGQTHPMHGNPCQRSMFEQSPWMGALSRFRTAMSGHVMALKWE